VVDGIAPSVKIIGLFYSALYCPPCHRIMQPLHDFYKEYNKSDKKELELILVSCDKKRSEYMEHLKQMPWIKAVPYDNEVVMAKLEDIG